ncbi:MAG: hypothetical protein MJ207_02555 [Bacilli bacterium]|nr:hypothetical protein [Bacilli bacterium]
MKKFLISFAVAATALISCNGVNKMYGTYSFMMGKEKETHFGVEVTLGDKNYVPPIGEESIEGAKQLALKLNLSDDIMPPEPDPDSPNVLEQFFAWMFATILCDGLDDGYYVLKEGLYEEGERLAIGFDLFRGLIPIPVPDDFIENFIVSYYNKKAKSVKLILPTSLMDLKEQLCWYGYFLDVKIDITILPDPLPPDVDVSITFVDLSTGEGLIDEVVITDPSLYKIELPPPPSGRVDRIGTHPTKDNEIYMNEKCKKLFDDVQKAIGGERFEFRDYHSLTVDLQKQ